MYGRGFKVNIVQMCSAHPKYDKRVYYKINLSLMKENHLVSIHPNEKKDIVHPNLIIDGYNAGNGKLKRLFSLFNLYKITSFYKPDIVICPEPDSFITGLLYKALNKNTKVIFDCHEWYELRDNKNILSKYFGKIVDTILTNSVRFADGVFVVNDTMRKKYVKFNTKTLTLINTLTLIEGNISNNNNNYKKQTFIYTGNFVDNHQKEILMRTAIELKKIKSKACITILGGISASSDYEEKKAEFEKELVNTGIDKHLIILPWMNKDAANTVISNAIGGLTRFDSYLYGDKHCLPNKVFDYLSQGVPIITCLKNAEIASIVKRYNCGYYTKNEDPKELAALLNKIYSDKDKVIEKSINAKRAFLDDLNWNIYEKKLQDFVKSL